MQIRNAIYKILSILLLISGTVVLSTNNIFPAIVSFALSLFSLSFLTLNNAAGYRRMREAGENAEFSVKNARFPFSLLLFANFAAYLSCFGMAIQLYFLFTEPAPYLYRTYAGIVIVYSLLSFLCSFRLTRFYTCYFIGEKIVRYDGKKEEVCILSDLSNTERTFSFKYQSRSRFDPEIAVCRILIPQHDLYLDVYVYLGEIEKADRLFRFTKKEKEELNAVLISHGYESDMLE